MNSETDLIAQRYARRGAAGMDGRYSKLRWDVCLSFQERQRALIDLFGRYAPSLHRLRVLEIGCGYGANLMELIWLGFDPARLVGNELLADRADVARRNLPDCCEVIEGDACTLAFPDGAFDIVYQSTVFTSILDAQFQRRLAECMWRWVKPGGAVLWYDFIHDNPSNPDVRGVPIRRVKELFPEGKYIIKRVTLAPPISRRVCHVHPLAYHIFNVIPWLRTHVVCWIGKE